MAMRSGKLGDLAIDQDFEDSCMRIARRDNCANGSEHATCLFCAASLTRETFVKSSFLPVSWESMEFYQGQDRLRDKFPYVYASNPYTTHPPYTDKKYILLCNKCHMALNGERLPLIIMLPSDLNHFIDYEKRNYNDRQVIANLLAGDSGCFDEEMTVPKRSVPTHEEFSQKYTLYPLNFRTKALLAPLKTRERMCGASPVPIILRSAMAMGLLVGNLEQGTGLPAEERKKLTKLLNLWSRPDPKVVKDTYPATAILAGLKRLPGNTSKPTLKATEEEYNRSKLKRRHPVNVNSFSQSSVASIGSSAASVSHDRNDDAMATTKRRRYNTRASLASDEGGGLGRKATSIDEHEEEPGSANQPANLSDDDLLPIPSRRSSGSSAHESSLVSNHEEVEGEPHSEEPESGIDLLDLLLEQKAQSPPSDESIRSSPAVSSRWGSRRATPEFERPRSRNGDNLEAREPESLSQVPGIVRRLTKGRITPVSRSRSASQVMANELSDSILGLAARF